MAKTSDTPSIPTANLHRLLPSELARMAESVSHRGRAEEILKAFADYLSLLKKPKEVELDDVTRIALQLNSIGLWKKINAEKFVHDIRPRVEARTLERLCETLNLTPPSHADVTPAPAPTVTLKRIAARLAEEHQISRKQSEAMLSHFITTVTKHLRKGDSIRLSGLGILQVRKHAARMGRNPATGEMIKIKAENKVDFRASKELKDKVS